MNWLISPIRVRLNVHSLMVQLAIVIKGDRICGWPDCSIEASLAAFALEVVGTSFVCAVLQEGMFTIMSAISNCNEVQDMRPEVKEISVDDHRRRYG